MSKVLLKNAVDAFVQQTYPDRNNNTGIRLYVRGGSTNQFYSYLYFGRPFPLGVTIISAKLRLTQGPALTGSSTGTVQRVAEKWSSSRLTWNNKPTTAGTLYQITKSSPAAGTLWEWDITAMMQEVADGIPWYGVRVRNSLDVWPNSYLSAQASTYDGRPELEIEWADNPEKPTDLFPSNGRAVSASRPVVRCDFTDISGDKTMAAIQVQVNTTTSFTAPAFDSGTVASTVPELDLSTTAFTALTEGQIRYWRVRVQDGAGLWSDWSDVESFKYNALGTLTITNPSGTRVEEATPPVTWTFTGKTQKAYELLVTRIQTVDGITIRDLPKSTGKITSTATSHTVPKGWIVDGAGTDTYIIEVRVWDTLDREAVANGPIYQTFSRTVNVNWVTAVTAATGLTVTPDTQLPKAVLNFSRTTLPDAWQIYRNNQLIANVVGADLFVSGTAYQYTDVGVPPRTDVTWKVVAVVNNSGSPNPPTVSSYLRPVTSVLTDVNYKWPILIYNASRDFAKEDDVTIFEPIGNAAPVAHFGSTINGYRGSMSGVASTSAQGITSAEMKRRFKYLTKDKGATLVLSLADELIQCFIYNARLIGRSTTDGMIYDISFDFYQTDAS